MFVESEEVVQSELFIFVIIELLKQLLYSVVVGGDIHVGVGITLTVAGLEEGDTGLRSHHLSKLIILSRVNVEPVLKDSLGLLIQFHC